MKRYMRAMGFVLAGVLVITVLLSAADAGAAAQERSPKHKPQLLTISGTIEKTDLEFVLKNPKRTLTVTGQDFTSLIGKRVRVTGKLTRTDQGVQILEVTKVRRLSKRGR